MDSAHHRSQLERLTFFSDAVFAIAMTLLVVEVKLPPLHHPSEVQLAQALLDLIPNYIGFLVSFLVLARFWASHHLFMGLLVSAPPRLVWANLLLLLAVAFMPFPTAVISEFVQLRVGVGFYTVWLMLIGLLNHHLVKVASDPAIRDPHADPALFRQFLLTSWIPLLIGGSAFALGMVSPLLSLVALTIGSPLISIWLRRRAARLNPTG
jgi:uncharacterized membrane protein